MNLMSELKNIDAQKGYDLIGEVASKTNVPTDDMIRFILNLVKIDNVDPKTMNLDQLKSAMINYIEKID